VKPVGVTLVKEHQPRRIIGYIAGFLSKIEPVAVPVEKLTHINYAFALIKDGEIVNGHKNDHQNLEILEKLKKGSDLKIIISVGGWTGSGPFSDMALTKESRRKFIKSAMVFMETYGLDGIDIDWEYPGLPGDWNTHRPEDKQNFTSLLRELRRELDLQEEKDRKKYLLTIAGAASNDYLAHTEMSKVHPYLDFINLMTYDYAGSWTPLTGHHCNLYASEKGSNPFGMSTHKTVLAYLNEGVPGEKICIGVAFYGRAWKDVTAKNNGLLQPGTALSGDFSFRVLMEKYIGKSGYKRYWDKAAAVPYLWNAETRHFISYDDEESIAGKCEYVNEKRLGGIMFWEFFSDYQGKLLKVIHEELATDKRR
jgi:chitinase